MITKECFTFTTHLLCETHFGKHAFRNYSTKFEHQIPVKVYYLPDLCQEFSPFVPTQRKKRLQLKKKSVVNYFDDNLILS